MSRKAFKSESKDHEASLSAGYRVLSTAKEET